MPLETFLLPSAEIEVCRSLLEDLDFNPDLLAAFFFSLVLNKIDNLLPLGTPYYEVLPGFDSLLTDLSFLV